MLRGDAQQLGAGPGERLKCRAKLRAPLADDVRLVDHEGSEKTSLCSAVDGARQRSHETLGRGEDDRLGALGDPTSNQLPRSRVEFAVVGELGRKPPAIFS